ncbi:hypothetical protein [Ferrimicrobium sp.]|uniref:hypothetical protein n=1 Tax=Ferrimicrobium sp. TaxID=2926050 RepID=UPI00260FBE97|nr:hypothetical protein [Ferrimicrobium sp.]
MEALAPYIGVYNRDVNSLTDKIESKFVDLSSDLPHLPTEFVAWLARWAWLIVAIVGVLYLFDALGFVTLANDFGYAGFFGDASFTSTLYLAAALTAVYGVWYLVAVPGLREHRRRGWQLLFYASLVQVVMVVVVVVLTGLGNIWSLLEVVVLWYLLFQIRPAFVASNEPE